MAKLKTSDPIKYRAVLYTFNNGHYKFLDWAICTTSLGAMAEPFTMNQRLIFGADKYGTDYDPSDPACRVDELRAIDPRKQRAFFAFAGSDFPVTEGDVNFIAPQESFV